MPKKPMTLKRAVLTAEMAMVLQRQVYAFDRNMFDRGIFTPHTENAKLKFEQLTEAIAFLRSLIDPLPVQLVTPVDPTGQQIDTNLDLNQRRNP